MAWVEEEDMAWCHVVASFTLVTVVVTVTSGTQRDFALTRAGNDELGNGGAGRRPTCVHRHHQRLEEDQVKLFFCGLCCSGRDTRNQWRSG